MPAGAADLYWTPYLFLRLPDLEGDVYRRRQKVVLKNDVLEFCHEVPSDDDGYPQQPSFIVKAELGLDAEGYCTNKRMTEEEEVYRQLIPDGMGKIA